MEFGTCSPTTGILMIALVLTVTSNAFAGDWMVVPRFLISEDYSDNIQLSPTNQRDDFITRVTPGISIRGQGRRVEMSVDYNLESLSYINEEELDNTNHQLQSTLSIEIIRNIFFLDANAAMYQALVSNTGRVSNRNLANDSNRTDVITYGFSPRFHHHFGTWADFNASTQVSDTIGDGSGSGNRSAGSGNSISLQSTLSSGRRFTRTSWSVSNSSTVFNNDSGARSNSQNWWDAQVSAVINRFLRANTSLGYEKNKSADGGAGNQDSITWSAGATLTLSPRTSLTGSYGKRSFGNTKSFDFSHRRRRISISGSYTEELQTTSGQLRDQQLVSLFDAFGEPVFDPFAASDPTLPDGNLSLTDDIFISRDFNATVGYTRRRDTFSASVFRTEREGGASSDPEEALGASVSWSRTMSRRLSGGVSGSFRSGSAGGAGVVPSNPSLQGSDASTEVIFVSPFVSYSIGPHTSGRLSYNYTTSSSEDSANEYTENSVTGSLSFAF